MFGKLIAAVYVSLLILAIIQQVHFYNTVNYQADIAGGYILGVKSTNNINDMKVYLQKALDQLNRYNYHGSPVLWPNPYTNFDTLKADIQNQINSLTEYQKTYNTTSDKSYAYQQTINNAKSSADTLNNRQSAINEQRGSNPYENPGVFVFIVLALIAWLPCLVVTEIYETWNNRRPYAEKPSFI